MIHSASEDRVSIVMITRNRAKQMPIALEHLLTLPERSKIIVVDNGSSDATVEVARATSRAIDVISLKHNRGCAGRNVGVLQADAPYIAFSDDDSWWAPGALSSAADLFDYHPTLGLIAARTLVGPDEKLDPLCRVMAETRFPDELQEQGCDVGIPVIGFAACGAIVRRQAFLEAGGFEQRLGIGGEENILALDLLRNGWHLSYVDYIVAYHHPSPVRDRAKRRRIEARNALWSAWLRRPAISALGETWRIVKQSFKDPAYRDGLGEAMLGLPWTLLARDPIPADIDRRVRFAERVFHADSLLSPES